MFETLNIHFYSLTLFPKSELNSDAQYKGNVRGVSDILHPVLIKSYEGNVLLHLGMKL